jgi:hypothetical protein
MKRDFIKSIYEDTAAYAGKEVTLTFEMKDAKLYAFEFLE